MKLLITSESWPPRRGGLSSMAALLADGLSARGHQVIGIDSSRDGTEAAAGEATHGATRIIKLRTRSGWWKYLRTLRSCDVVLQNNVALRSLLLPLFLRKQVVVALHIWLTDSLGRLTWREKLKIAALKRVSLVVGPNLEVLERAGLKGQLVPNGYDDGTFTRLTSYSERTGGIVAVGRLIPQKGFAELVQAFALIADEFPDVGLTIVGDGPERSVLLEKARGLGIHQRLALPGGKTPSDLAGILNESRLLCLPSTGEEIFGLVILEALACGTPVLATRIGGIPEAVGQHGVLVNPGPALIYELARELRNYFTGAPDTALRLLDGVEGHLSRYTRSAALDAYEGVLIGRAQCGR